MKRRSPCPQSKHNCRCLLQRQGCRTKAGRPPAVVGPLTHKTRPAPLPTRVSRPHPPSRVRPQCNRLSNLLGPPLPGRPPGNPSLGGRQATLSGSGHPPPAGQRRGARQHDSLAPPPAYARLACGARGCPASARPGGVRQRRHNPPPVRPRRQDRYLAARPAVRHQSFIIRYVTVASDCMHPHDAVGRRRVVVGGKVLFLRALEQFESHLDVMGRRHALKKGQSLAQLSSVWLLTSVNVAQIQHVGQCLYVSEGVALALGEAPKHVLLE